MIGFTEMMTTNKTLRNGHDAEITKNTMMPVNDVMINVMRVSNTVFANIIIPIIVFIVCLMLCVVSLYSMWQIGELKCE